MTVGVPLPDAPAPLTAREVFRANGVVFTVADLARRASVSGREAPFAASTPDQAEENFRRARGLLRADQLEAWLASWEISAADFRRWTTDVASGTRTTSEWCRLLCSGTFDLASAELIAAVAAACELGAGPVDADGFDPDGWTARLLEARSTPQALSAALDQHRLDWTRLQTVTVRCAERALAEELRHQVLSDGADLGAAAAAAGCPALDQDEVLAAFSPLVRAALAGARSAELIGPVPTAEAWTLILVASRIEPSLTDPAIRARAQAAIGHEVITRAVAAHVVA